jgi:hypothetical protein
LSQFDPEEVVPDCCAANRQASVFLRRAGLRHQRTKDGQPPVEIACCPFELAPLHLGEAIPPFRKAAKNVVDGGKLLSPESKPRYAAIGEFDRTPTKGRMIDLGAELNPVSLVGVETAGAA